MVEQMLVDSHVHFWDPQARRYAWLDGQPSLRRRFGPEDYGGGGRVAALIFVQADCRDDEALDEVRWAAELAARDPRVRGIVAYALVHLGVRAAAPIAAVAAQPGVVGVRRLLHGSTRIVAGEMSIELSEETLAARPALQAYAGRAIVLGIRPEGLNDAALAPDDHQPRLRGHAELREALGSEVLMHFSVSARAAVTEEVRELAEDVGDDRVIKQLASDERATLVGRFSPATRIREGDTIDVALDESALHFFDPSTGEAIYDDAADRVALS